MSARWLGFLKRLFGKTPGRPAPTPPIRPRPSVAARPGTPSIVYRDRQPRPSAAPSLRWRKERFSVPSLPVNSWARRASTRQRMLVGAAALSLVALTVSAVSRMTARRVLPAEVHGIWVTDAPAYANRRFELRARAVAFTTGRPGEPVRPLRVLRVSSAAEDRATRFRVEYDAEGETAEFQFLVTGEVAPTIHFANQPLLTWRRLSTTQTMIPAAY